MKIEVLTHVHKIKCPHCGKEIFLAIGEGHVRKDVEESEINIKTRIIQWLENLPLDRSFTVEDVVKAMKEKGIECNSRKIGRILRTLVDTGYLDIVGEETAPYGGKRNVYMKR